MVPPLQCVAKCRSACVNSGDVYDAYHVCQSLYNLQRYAGILLVWQAYIALCDALTSGPCVWPTDDWDGDPGTSKRNRATSKLYGQPT